MNVKELIEKLQKFDPEISVLIEDDENYFDPEPELNDLIKEECEEGVFFYDKETPFSIKRKNAIYSEIKGIIL